MQGIVFSIEEFSVYDGPGIRTTVFLKGCPLKCEWCHNPEGQKKDTEIVRSPNGCINCKNCEKNAVRENNTLIYTRESIENCPKNLLRYSGEKYTPGELFKIINKNAEFLKNGGVTFSGGEPFMQSEFLIQCLKRFKGKINTCIQTSGYVSESIFKKALPYTDFMLYDLKIIDEEKHKKYTGVSNKMILSNLSVLSKSGIPFIIRVPLIPTVTDTKENIAAICGLLKSLNIPYAELLPYNKMAGGKYKSVGRKYEPSFDEKTEVNIHPEIWSEHKTEIKVL